MGFSYPRTPSRRSLTYTHDAFVAGGTHGSASSTAICICGNPQSTDSNSGKITGIGFMHLRAPEIASLMYNLSVKTLVGKNKNYLGDIYFL